MNYSKEQLLAWCRTSVEDLTNHPDLKVPLRICTDSESMGALMADELVEVIESGNKEGRVTRAILPAGPTAWYQPFARQVNQNAISLRNLVVYHMDDCLDWEGKTLPEGHPYNFRTFMQRRFYDPVSESLAVPDENRRWLTTGNYLEMSAEILTQEIDITIGGWGQDGHLAYNQAPRHPYHTVTVDQLRESTARVQVNNLDTVIALSQRMFGGAYQFVPPMSITLGIKECLSAKKVRLYSDTGAWKQTALRVALFGPLTPEYPFTLLQEHPDALLTATRDTAAHPLSQHPEWELL